MTSTSKNAQTLPQVTLANNGVVSPGYGAVGASYSYSAVINSSNPWTFSDGSLTAPTSAKIALKGENADIEIGDKSLMSILDAIESRLGLIKLNPELEAEFEELRRIGDEYRAAEKRMLEKRQIWETLKKE